MRFREHRRTLDESMSTVQNFDGRAALVAFIQKKLLRWGKQVEDADVKIESYSGDDDRLTPPWRDTHIVTVDDWGVFGFTEGRPSEMMSDSATIFTITVVGGNEFNEGWLAYVIGETDPSVADRSAVFMNGWEMAADTDSCANVRAVFKQQRSLDNPQYVVTKTD